LQPPLKPFGGGLRRPLSVIPRSAVWSGSFNRLQKLDGSEFHQISFRVDYAGGSGRPLTSITLLSVQRQVSIPEGNRREPERSLPLATYGGPIEDGHAGVSRKRTTPETLKLGRRPFSCSMKICARNQPPVPLRPGGSVSAASAFRRVPALF